MLPGNISQRRKRYLVINNYFRISVLSDIFLSYLIYSISWLNNFGASLIFHACDGRQADGIDVSHEVVIPDISLRLIDSYASNIGYLARGCHQSSPSREKNDKMLHVGDYSLASSTMVSYLFLPCGVCRAFVFASVKSVGALVHINQREKRELGCLSRSLPVRQRACNSPLFLAPVIGASPLARASSSFII